MLSGSHFYYQSIRRTVVAFGNLFKDVVLVKYANDLAREELSRQTVPLFYGGKEDFWVRLSAQPTLPAAADINLPVISFSMMGIQYDPQRKQQSMIQNYYQTPTGVSRQYAGVPYNLKFSIWIFVRNIEDGTQIVEQILPWFNPDFTQTLDMVDAMGIVRNIPITLDDVMWDNDYQGTAKDTMRAIVWQLDFTLQTYFYGPIDAGGSIIKTVSANIHSMLDGIGETPAYSDITMDTAGLGTYKLGETVYMGNSLPDATAIGTVVNFNPPTLTITNVRGTFQPNANVHGSLSAASWEALNVPQNANLASIVVTPVPPTANVTDDFGYLTVITETPDLQ